MSEPILLDPNNFTFGFEIETWANIRRYESYFRRLGFSQIYEDPSGPLETQSPAMRMFTDVSPALIYPSLAIDYRKRRSMEQYGSSAGTHHHVAHTYWSRRLVWAEELFTYLKNHVNMMAPFFSRKMRRDGDRLVPTFTQARREWAGTPGCFHPISRRYWTVTPNPSGSHKPFTLEIRLCETAPIACSAAIHVLVAGFVAGVYYPYTDDYRHPVPVKTIETYVNHVDSKVPLPDWVHKFINASIENGKRPVTIVGLLRRGVIASRHLDDLIRALGLAGPGDLPRAGELGEELLDYLRGNGL